MNLFVAKLSPDTTQDDLQQLFETFGVVNTAKVIMDRETGRSKCYGFVEMATQADGLRAIESLNDNDFQGSVIVVKKQNPVLTINNVVRLAAVADNVRSVPAAVAVVMAVATVLTVAVIVAVTVLIGENAVLSIAEIAMIAENSETTIT